MALAWCTHGSGDVPWVFLKEFPSHPIPPDFYVAVVISHAIFAAETKD
jgi:hypothetical protein